MMSPQSSLGYVGLILSVIIIAAEQNTLHRLQSWNFTVDISFSQPVLQGSTELHYMSSAITLP